MVPFYHSYDEWKFPGVGRRQRFKKCRSPSKKEGERVTGSNIKGGGVDQLSPHQIINRYHNDGKCVGVGRLPVSYSLVLRQIRIDKIITRPE